MTVFDATSLFSQKIARALARGLVALLVLSHALVAFSNAISPSHDPLRVTTHAHPLAGAETSQDDHGHSHEVFDDEGGMLSTVTTRPTTVMTTRTGRRPTR